MKNPMPLIQLNRPADLADFMRRAESGDESTLPALRRLLHEDSALVEAAGNLAGKHQRAVIEHAAGADLVCREAILRHLERLRGELSGDDVPPLERLLVERIVSCWLALHDAEWRFTRATDLSLGQARAWQDGIDRAQKRYLSAVKALAHVRKLALPVVQVNIGQEQVNMAS